MTQPPSSCRGRREWALRAAAVVVVVAALAGCGSGGSSAGSGSGNLTVAVFNPFSGADASFGPEQMGGCVPAARLITAAGGILGHKSISCLGVDSKGDPADAVPAAGQLLATTSNLVGVLGPSSDEATATVPLFNRQHMIVFGNTGQAVFDHSTYPYFWRNTPPDDANGLVLALWAHHAGYTRAAAVFGQDIGSAGQDPPATKGFKHLGGTIVVDLKVALDQSSYRVEVEQILAAKPQVIFLEIDPQSSATLLAELKQLHGSLIPVIGTDITVEPPWQKAVLGAVGAGALKHVFAGTQPYSPATGPAWKAFNAELLKAGSQVPNPSQWSADPYSQAAYDSVNVMALAMLAAHSTAPAKYQGSIISITTPGSGKIVVHSFASGKAALAAGKSIQYVGPTGPLAYDQWHNSPGAFEVTAYGPNGRLTQILHVFGAAQISALATAIGH
jgi:ABC-type branched-subunit amino acid transport system substrate-binding protein